MPDDRIDPSEHARYVRGIARGVRDDYGFGRDSEEGRDLEAVAALELAKQVARFDESRVPPDGDLFGAFRGYAAPWVRGECRRLARKLKAHGARGADPDVRHERLPESRDGESLLTAPVRDDAPLEELLGVPLPDGTRPRVRYWLVPVAPCPTGPPVPRERSSPVPDAAGHECSWAPEPPERLLPFRVQRRLFQLLVRLEAAV